jgi:hypothetical protein
VGPRPVILAAAVERMFIFTHSFGDDVFDVTPGASCSTATNFRVVTIRT